MLYERNTDVKVEGNLSGDKVAMTIDENSLAHIMSVLTDLYSDPELAVLREYSTNAYDAHVEAGEPNRPIDVTLPSPLSPFLKIRDYGVGLSVKDIHEIYSKYGASTKRGTNDQTGMLGLGCKSALTYADQFTLTSVKDGTRCQVVVSRDEDATGSMTVVDTSSTDEQDGTEILIPARRENSFEAKAENFFRFWEPGTVHVNGKEPKRFEGIQISDRIWAMANVNGRYDRQAFVVMGNVPYPVEPEHIPSNLGYEYSFVAFVGMGDVHFPPNREQLHYTSKTKSTLAELKQEFEDHVNAAIERKINEATTRWDAIAAWQKWRGLSSASAPNRRSYQRLGNTGIYYKGEEIPTNIAAKDSNKPFRIVPVYSGVLSRNDNTVDLSVEYIPESVWFYGFDKAKFTANHRRKLNLYVQQNNLGSELSARGGRYVSYILSHEKPDSKWIDPSKVFKWKDIEAIKLPRKQATVSGRIAGAYDTFYKGSRQQIPADDLDTSLPIYYTTLNVYSVGGVRKALTETKHKNEDFTLVYFQANRKNKFLRLYPQALDATEALRPEFEKWVKSVPEDVVLRESLDRYDYGGLAAVKYLDASKVDDPDLKKYTHVANIDPKDYYEKQGLFASVGFYHDLPRSQWRNPLGKYPLFNARFLTKTDRAKDHTYLYLNAAYAAEKKEG